MLRDGVKPAVRIGHSQRAARQILDNVNIPWSQQVAVMFQIICALAFDVPDVLHELERLRGVPPNVQLSCEPWGHMNHEDNDCVCLSSDRTGTCIVHQLRTQILQIGTILGGKGLLCFLVTYMSPKLESTWTSLECSYNFLYSILVHEGYETSTSLFMYILFILYTFPPS